jgi:hypothetical protein
MLGDLGLGGEVGPRHGVAAGEAMGGGEHRDERCRKELGGVQAVLASDVPGEVVDHGDVDLSRSRGTRQSHGQGDQGGGGPNPSGLTNRLDTAPVERTIAGYRDVKLGGSGHARPGSGARTDVGDALRVRCQQRPRRALEGRTAASERGCQRAGGRSLAEAPKELSAFRPFVMDCAWARRVRRGAPRGQRNEPE